MGDSNRNEPAEALTADLDRAIEGLKAHKLSASRAIRQGLRAVERRSEALYEQLDAIDGFESESLERLDLRNQIVRALDQLGDVGFPDPADVIGRAIDELIEYRAALVAAIAGAS
jgi:hypothetical protein